MSSKFPEMKKIENVISEIDSLLSQDLKDIQNWKDVEKWPLLEAREINGTVSTKIIHRINHFRFITQIPPLCEFGKHWHVFPETCKIISGTMGDKVRGRTWKENDVAMFSAGQKHNPWNPSKTETCYLIVDFYNY